MCLGHGQGQPGQGGIALTPLPLTPALTTLLGHDVAVAIEKVAVGGQPWQGEGTPGDSLLVSQGSSGWVTGDGGTAGRVLKWGPGGAGPAWEVVVAMDMEEC